MSALYDLRDVRFSHPGRGDSLRNVTLRIARGEHLALLGANGAGKSTLLHILAGLEHPSEGSISFEDRELTRSLLETDKRYRREFRQRVGILFQNSDLQLFCSRVREEVAFGPLQILPREEAMLAAERMMRAFNIEELAEEPPYALSGGEKRRVALAAVLVMQPDVLLLDEPMANLDPKTADFLFDVLRDYMQDPQKTVVTTTHDLETARYLSRFCAVLAPDHTIACHAQTDQVLDDLELLAQVNLISPRRAKAGATISPTG